MESITQEELLSVEAKLQDLTSSLLSSWTKRQELKGLDGQIYRLFSNPQESSDTESLERIKNVLNLLPCSQRSRLNTVDLLPCFKEFNELTVKNEKCSQNDVYAS